jgi:pyruvate dehydrogenase E2 component (dihydrolipoamide acetyltransferase)
VPVEVTDEIAAQLENFGVRRGTYTLDPLSRIHKVIAQRLTEAARDIPTFPLSMDLDIDALLAQRSTFNQANATKVSVNDLLVKACALALKEVPAVNSSFTPLGMVRHKQADVAVAVATDLGLMTPIVFAAEGKSVMQIATETKGLAERARAGKLQANEYLGGTFTISNLGMFGIASFGSIINPPHAAILSVGAGRPTVIPDGSATRVATLMNVTLTCDHRAIDGAMGAKWLNAFRRRVEQPNGLFE